MTIRHEPGAAVPAPPGFGPPTGGPPEPDGPDPDPGFDPGFDPDPDHGRADARRRRTLIAVGVLLALVLAAGLAVLLSRGTSGRTPAHRPGASGSGTHAAPTAGSPAAAPTDSAPGTGAPSPTPPSPSPSPSPSASASASASPTDPAGVVTAYYNDINQHDYQAAWQLGGDHLGEPYSSFVSGFRDTTQDTVAVTGVSGDTVTVTLVARNSDGSTADYSGDYTVRDGVITGASLESTG
ncbi:hypothetical protein [Streptacidiphilus sp. P02-A3a]|uniref:hypothetical protein n=1 Tax=Streptacidiphilus sp. P02-A3a TaxID=2704468 RepID=UPI0015F881E9|nr:hypothetical protein [Streptacidiphilus sp. P02-A3a]QMU70157.1 hypothetical protein GXP74_19905 [Streptacidiphilus sp. P02-A3a]QMU70393.1 hypothetical protein GXP74_21450 [Streptacidiphilus sp. P02-A3a]